MACFVMACPGPGGDGGNGGGTAGGGGGTGGGAATGQAWTVLVYMVADNDLEPFSLLDLQEMADVGSNSGLNIIAQVDRSPDYSSAPVLNIPNWTTTKRFKVNQGSLTQLADLGEVDMAAPATLTDFIKWGLATYPADKTALVLWDHGGGSLLGFGVDEAAQNDIMSVPSIQKGISDGLSQAGKTKFDLIGFDACLMATFEVAEALKNLGSYLVVSEESEPGHGWDYRAFAGVNGATTPAALGQKIADGFKSQAQEATWHDDAKITLSVVDLSKLGPLETALTALSTTYPSGASLAPVVTALGQGLNGAIKFGDNPDPTRAYNLVDLVDVFSKATGVQGAAAIQAAVAQAVTYQVTGSATANAHGLSIYFPPAATYYSNKYTALATLPGVKGITEWNAFLTAYFGGGSAGGTPAFGAGTYDVSTTQLTVSAPLTSTSGLTDAFMVYGVYLNDATTVVLLGEIEASLSNNTVTGTWDWTGLELTQGTTVEFAYLALRALNSTQGIASIPMAYEYGGQQQEAIRALVFTLADGSIVSDKTYVYAVNGALGELTPQVGSKLHAKVAVLTDSTSYTPTWRRFDETAGSGFDATQPVTLTFVSVVSGAKVYGGLRVENAAHQGAYVYTPATVTKP